MSKLVFSQRLEDLKKKKFYTEHEFSKYQEKLYKARLLGLKVYSKEEQRRMSLAEKLDIQIKHKATRKIINTWKAQLVNSKANRLMDTLFNHSRVARTVCSLQCKGIDPELKSKVSFSSLGISKNKVMNKLVKEGLLPKNFFYLDKPKKNESMHRIQKNGRI